MTNDASVNESRGRRPFFPDWLASYVDANFGKAPQLANTARTAAFIRAFELYDATNPASRILASYTRLPSPPHSGSFRDQAEAALKLRSEVAALQYDASTLSDSQERRQYLLVKVPPVITRYGTEAVKALMDAVFAPFTTEEMAADLLEIAACTPHGPSLRYRKWLIERGLQCTSPYVRFAATASASELCDNELLGPLKHALDLENVPPLQRQIEQAIASISNE